MYTMNGGLYADVMHKPHHQPPPVPPPSAAAAAAAALPHQASVPPSVTLEAVTDHSALPHSPPINNQPLHIPAKRLPSSSVGGGPRERFSSSLPRYEGNEGRGGRPSIHAYITTALN